MAEKQESTLFRKKAMERITSPEDLTSYLRVTNPGMWMVLAAVIILLVGMLAWSMTGTLQTTIDAKAIVKNHTAEVVAISQGTDTIESGMPLKIASQDFMIAYVEYDEYGRAKGLAEVSLPDGSYDAKIVIEETHPIQFLLESR